MAHNKLFAKLRTQLPIKTGSQPGPVAGGILRQEQPQFKLVLFILDWKRVHVLSDVITKEDVRFHAISMGRGTARSETLDLLGIGAEDKAIVSCLEQSVLVPILMKEALRKINFNNPGQGIAFTIPLSAINDPILLAFKQSIFKNKKITVAAATAMAKPVKKGKTMAKEFSHDLIVSIVNNGYSDAFMDTARAAGAAGGTVMHARGLTHEGMVKLFGISVQDEKEIIFILTSREKKAPIMQAVCEAHGLNSDARGIVFSLPVDDVMGLGFDSM